MTNEPTFAEELYMDADGDVCVGGRRNNLVFLPAVDDDGRVQHPDIIDRIIDLWNASPTDDKDATIARLTAELTEAKLDLEWMTGNRNTWQDAATRRLTRAEQAEAKLAEVTAAGTFAQGIEAAQRDKIARIIALEHLQLLTDFDVDGDLYRLGPEFTEFAYTTADAILRALAGEQP